MSKSIHERVEELAKQANAGLERRKRNDDDRRGYITAKDDAPEWLQDLCRHAHANMFPDDWKYEFIQDALAMLEDDADAEGRDMDEAYPYTADRLHWLASSLERPGYCDEAAEEYGLPKKPNILAFIAIGMQQEANEVFDLVKSWIEERAEEEDEAEQEAIEASNDADAMQEEDDAAE